MCRDIPRENEKIEESGREGWGKEERLGCKGGEIGFWWEKPLDAEIGALSWDNWTNFEAGRQGWG